jgi:ABC-type antimicrobial peptide transport system ATPase subunit
VLSALWGKTSIDHATPIGNVGKRFPFPSDHCACHERCTRRYFKLTSVNPERLLDVSVQAQVLNLLVDLKREYNLSYLFISHDLAVVQYISDRVMVMKDGKIIETGDHASIWQTPATDYTRELIAAST